MRSLEHRLLCSRHLRYFIAESFNVSCPGTEFLNNWHIAFIAGYLEAVTKGEIKRLIINVPPRYLKSTCVSVCWPAWLLGNDPTRRILCASYSMELSIKHSIDTRHLMNSELYTAIFPKTEISSTVNRNTKFITENRGFRFSTSVGGTITGEGGDFLILDDPHNALYVNSAKSRRKVVEWFHQSFLSRLDSKKDGVIVIVMQRLHPHDLTGYLLENQSSIWHHLNIPAIAEKSKTYSIGKYIHTVSEGELLHVEREGEKEIKQISEELGSYAFSAQYLQNPICLDSGMIKIDWLVYYDEIPARDNIISIMQSWDTAIKSGDYSSYSVGTTWGEFQGSFYLLDVYRSRIEYPELKREIIAQARKWQPDHILIEDKASGQSVIQDLRNDYQYLSVIPCKPSKDKVTRFARVTVLFERSRVLIARNANWRNDYEQELLAFPVSSTNDQVDSTSQYLNYILDNNRFNPRVR